MKNITDFINTELNTQQRDAVQNIRGPLLVIAGAGSGKTRVITARIAHLLHQENTFASNIVALTFTNKAAAEMKERIKTFLDDAAFVPFVGTFHSYCLYLLKTNQHFLPFGQFSIIDEDDKRSVINGLLKKSPLYKKHTAQQISYQISLIKNQCKHPDQDIQDTVQNRLMHDLLMAYEKEKRASNCFDFDDLLLEAVKLFDNEDFVNKHHKTVRHILVDEYQDTNTIQHELLKKMSLCDKKKLTIDSVCAVGDEDQSIYSWRGATVDNIIHFQNDFKNTKKVKIEQNYRSKEPILKVANAVIGNNTKRNEKKLWSDQKGKDCVRMLSCLSGYQEAEIIAHYCKILANNKKLTSTAILYRTHLQSRLLEEALIKHSVSYTLLGGIRFYERKEIKDVLSYLKLINNPHDRVAFARAINCPARGLGSKFLEQFLLLWDQHPEKPFTQIGALLIEQKDVTGLKSETLQTFLDLFKHLTPESSAPETISELLLKIEYNRHLTKNYQKEELEERKDNIKEFINAAHFFATQNKKTVEDLLEQVALLQEKSNEDTQTEKQHVQLMTLHAAKGLEFDRVILPGLEENLFPSARSTNNREQLEEERRLFYVGITRARKKVLITSAVYRQTYGQMEKMIASRFLQEIPDYLCKADIASSWQTHQILTYLNQWFGFSTYNPEIFTFASSTFTKREPVKKTITPAHKTQFKKFEAIKHPVFGIGIIKGVQNQSNKTIVTAQFKVGLKKLDSKFITKI